jgi:CBS domain containing-hemolysin-like protein
VGYVDAKDLFQRALNNQPISLKDGSPGAQGTDRAGPADAGRGAGPVPQVHEDFAVIVNEYSLVVGVVTLNDVMSTVMGDLVTPMTTNSRSCAATHTPG